MLKMREESQEDKEENDEFLKEFQQESQKWYEEQSLKESFDINKCKAVDFSMNTMQSQEMQSI